MKEGPDIAALAALIGDPARANMLSALMAGLALTAGELAAEAGVTPQTAAAHLGRLREAGLIVVEIQGRHRYHRLAGPEVAEAIETLMGLAGRTGRLRTRPGPRDEALRRARVCYDHIAGRIGVRLHDRLVEGGLVAAGGDGLVLSAAGRDRFRAEGIDVETLESAARPLCRTCLDWSERRPHLAGGLAAAILRLALERSWLRRDPMSRALLVGGRGEAALDALSAPTTAARRAGAGRSA